MDVQRRRGNFKSRCPGRIDVDTVRCLEKGRGYFQHPPCEGYGIVFGMTQHVRCTC